MKAIIVSQITLELLRARLIDNLSKSMRDREEKIRTNSMTGMAAEPDSSITYHVNDIFDQLKNS